MSGDCVGRVCALVLRASASLSTGRRKEERKGKPMTSTEVCLHCVLHIVTWNLVPSCTVSMVAPLLRDRCVPPLQQPAFMLCSLLSDALGITTEMESNKVKVDYMYTNSLMNSKLNKYLFVMIFFSIYILGTRWIRCKLFLGLEDVAQW